MNDVMATIGLTNFRHIAEIVGRQRDNAQFYNEAFKDNEKIMIAKENPEGKSSYWLYTIHVNNRDLVMNKLHEYNIMSSKVHARNDIHTMFKEFRCDLPNVEKFNQTHLCIPVGWWVTNEQREYIAEKVNDIVKEYA